MPITRFYIKEWTSKNDNKVRAIFAVAEDGKEYFVCYVK